MPRYVLDSSAILAVLLDESGADKVMHRIRNGLCCSVNVTEIVTRLIDKGQGAQDAVADFMDTGIEIADFDAELALLAGRLRPLTRHKGLSLGDRACLALAIRSKAVAVTADRSWTDLDLGCEIEVFR